MMSEYYDHYHRWEPLAEFNFIIDSDGEELDDDNYVYCLCSRAFIRDGVKTYYVDKEDASESDVEVVRDSQSQGWEDHSHVHFSLDTSYKVKCEKDDGASCYCSASHTENCCSTDEHDAPQIPGTISHALQPSDSGADLTYQDCHSDYTTHDKEERMDQDFPIQNIAETNEDYLSENTWDKFWAVNGERIIWASWIKKYSDYINPAYLDENNDLLMDDNNIPKQRSIDQIYQSDLDPKAVEEDSIRERKFSYDSKVNPYKKVQINQSQTEKAEKSNDSNKDDAWLPLRRKRSCSEHDRIVSPRTLAATDSMTNVTKLTLSSYDVTSSHVTSESTPTDDYSVSSSTTDDQSNDQTRITNVEENLDQVSLEELDTEQYWQFLWKKHFGEQYALHFANYVEMHNTGNKEIPVINVEIVLEQKENTEEKILDIECENSEGNSQEMPTIIEVQTQVDQMKLEQKVPKPKKRNKKANHKYMDSVGVLLQNLLKEEQKKNEDNKTTEVTEAGEVNTDKNASGPTTVDAVDGNVATSNIQQSVSNDNFTSYSYDDGDDDPPEDTPVTLKRSHEIDDEEITSEKIKATFEIMGFNLRSDKMPKGQLVYRKRLARLRPPRSKKVHAPRKTYFDDEGNPYQLEETKDSLDEREMQTDDDCPDVKSDAEKPTGSHNKDLLETAQSNLDNVEATDITALEVEPTEYDVQNKDPSSDNAKEIKDLVLEASAVPLPLDTEPLSDAPETSEEHKAVVESVVMQNVETSKRRRRAKRYSRIEDEELDLSDMPADLRDDPKMLKYWKKRHSLFHRYDEGIKLDRESFFSVTPESVARHIARKYTYDVVLDAFCGAAGNTIQFAHTSKKVIAIDIDQVKIEMARHNAEVYGVTDRIQFIVGDFFELAPGLKADMVFLSPPWGGPKYSENHQYDLETMLEPRPASELMRVARTISHTVTLYLPRNTRSDQILALAREVGGSVEVEQSYLDKRFVAITAYYY